MQLEFNITILIRIPLFTPAYGTENALTYFQFVVLNSILAFNTFNTLLLPIQSL